jgi:UDP-glucose 4-epimerase
VRKAVKDCESVFHLASAISVEYTERHPIETLDTNISGIKNVLECCLHEDVKRLLFTSSSEVYGEPAKIPVLEDSPLQPKSCYGVSKVVCEEYIKAYSKSYGLNCTIVRYFNVYGPRQSTSFVIPKFVDLALKQQTITVYGSGRQIRAFCFIDDIIEGTFLAFKKATNDLFNIGNDKEPIEMGDLAKKIIQLTKSSSRLEFVSLNKTDRSEQREINKRAPDITKSRKILGYEPKVMLDEGLMKVIEHTEVRR